MHRSVGILILLAASFAAAQEPRAVDITKRRVVEQPTEDLLAEVSRREDSTAVPMSDVKPAPADRTKRVVIEPAAEAIVRGTQPPDAAAGEGPSAAGDNPRVEPGIVKWHDNVAAAIAAAKKSGKPVLVFHLLGQLDQRFT